MDSDRNKPISEESVVVSSPSPTGTPSKENNTPICPTAKVKLSKEQLVRQSKFSV